HELMPDVLEKAIRLRQQVVFVFPDAEVHLIERSKLVHVLCDAYFHPIALRLLNSTPRRAIQFAPVRINVRAQVQPMPFSAIDEQEATISQWDAVMQAAHRDRHMLDEQPVQQGIPLVRRSDQWIAVV